MRETEPVKLTGDTHVKDLYGNNAAVECPACGQTLVFSAHLNKRKGRVCPHCDGSKATVQDALVSVKVIKMSGS